MNPESPRHRESVKQKIAEIEAEMKKIKMWQDGPLKPEKYHFTKAFGMDTMAFAEWLEFIFIPRVHKILDTNGEFPNASMVAAQAVREFDGYEEAGRLIELLSEFDAMFN